jgi:hypothetical protein
VLACVCFIAMAWIHPRIALAFLGILALAWAAFVAFVPPSARTTFQ